MSGWGRMTPVDSTAGEGAAEGFDLGIAGCGKREGSAEDVYALSVFEAKALLGQSFLGEGLLCRYSGR